MPKLVKRKNWFAQNGLLASGIFCLLMLLATFVLYVWKDTFIIVGGVIFGIGNIYTNFKMKKRSMDKEFVSWDEEKIIVQQFRQEPLLYKWEEIDQIKLSDKNLTIKSGAANGIMFELKGFRREDVQKLKSLLTFQPAA